MVALKKLDRKAKLPVNLFAYAFGSIALLVLGTGMRFCVKVLGDGSSPCMVLGVVIGILGMQAGMKKLFLEDDVLKPIYRRFEIPEDKFDDWSSYYLAGTTAIVARWVEGGCFERDEEVALILLECVRPGSKGTIRPYRT